MDADYNIPSEGEALVTDCEMCVYLSIIRDKTVMREGAITLIKLFAILKLNCCQGGE